LLCTDEWKRLRKQWQQRRQQHQNTSALAPAAGSGLFM